jgi:nitrile hydratase accessory protein
VKPAVDTAVADMPGPAALPRRNGELVFEAPWEGRAFGLALAVVRQLGLDWSEFQRHLIAEIAKHPEAPYYECWVTALEALVLDRRVVATGELEATRQAIERASG